MSVAFALSEMCLHHKGIRRTTVGHANFPCVVEMVSALESAALRLGGATLLAAVVSGEECSEAAMHNPAIAQRGVMPAVIASGAIDFVLQSLWNVDNVPQCTQAHMRTLVQVARSSVDNRSLLVAQGVPDIVWIYLKGIALFRSCPTRTGGEREAATPQRPQYTRHAPRRSSDSFTR